MVKCKVTKQTPPLRSFTCQIRQKCVPKYEFFSLHFMTTFGARNIPLYLVFWTADLVQALVPSV